MKPSIYSEHVKKEKAAKAALQMMRKMLWYSTSTCALGIPVMLLGRVTTLNPYQDQLV